MITINGKTYNGNNLTMSGNKIIIDGVEINDLNDTKEINIQVDGNINSIDLGSAKSFIVNGSVGSINTASGDVKCQNVTGSVKTVSGDVDCLSVGGDVTTLSGDVEVEQTVGGNVKTQTGDIKYAKS